ncbi:hypothetical protein PS718_00003 [Pseudomonas fluorescens]|uniref:Uncharacterized protein n=1 Tax=Pseudomonas fluorescens TaxID=294 RepID=A0A5E6ZDA4_PSEFL|nr:hypothetical protein [Pseudomonas fluorescens]VVN64502.1 hypothetical protein PS718_00003 [Pseudomonas fluorescens]
MSTINQPDKSSLIFNDTSAISEGELAVSYTVTPLNQTSEPSQVMKVRGKLTRPGGHDDNGEPHHSQLIMSIAPKIISSAIDKDNVAAGALITIGEPHLSNEPAEPPYPNAAAGDQIQVSWGGAFVLSERLTQDQAEGKTPVVVHIDEATIREADDIGEEQRLAAPIALDAVSGSLDPELKTVRIDIPFDEFFAAGQAIQLFWNGTRPELTPYLPQLPLRPITSSEITAGEPLRHYVSGATHLPPINGGELELYYKLLVEDPVLGTMNRVNQTHAIRESIHAEILQIGEPRLGLPEPKVDGVADGALPADTNGTNLTMEYRGTAKGDEVTYHWIGSNTGEASDSVILSSFTAGQPLQFPIKAELIKANEDGTVSASYSIKRATGETSYSDAFEFRVGSAMDLIAPAIMEASGDTLYPLAAKDALTVVVPHYIGMQATDMYTVTWDGTPDRGSQTTILRTVGTVGPKTIELNKTSAVAYNYGQKVRVYYEIYRKNTQTTSESLNLTVQKITNGDVQLPSPIIDGNLGSELDVTNLPPMSELRVAGWPFITHMQRMWLHYYEEDNATPFHTHYNGTQLSDGELDGVQTNTPGSKLKALANGTKLRVEFKVSIDGSTDESTAVTFPVRNYIVKNPV